MSDVVGNDVQAAHGVLIKDLRQEINYLQTKVHVLEEQNGLLLKKLFGNSSEKFGPTDAEAATLFAVEAPVEEESQQPETIAIPSHVRRKGGRKPLSEKLPREERVIDLTEEEKECKGCGNSMQKIGEDISERAKIIPPKIMVEKVIRPKYGCHHCDVPPISKDLPYVLPHSIATNETFAYVITAKFCDSIPFHRMQGILSRYGVDYAKANMSNNAIQFHEKYGEKIVGLLEKQVTRTSLLQIDETTLQVLQESNRRNQTKSYVWAFRGLGVTLFSYRQTRHSGFLYDMLQDYRGVVLTDGYTGYDSALTGLLAAHAGCNAHARRYFVEAADAGYEEARLAIKFYARLYKVEAATKEKSYDPQQLLDIRQKESKVIMSEFRDWLYAKRAKASGGKNALGKAVSYTLNQWPKLTLFLSNGQIPIDNNAVENAIRPFVVGRNNWQFCGSPRGAEASCLYYSLIETAKTNGHEPYWYLRRLFDALPSTCNNSDIEKLMPYNLKPTTDDYG